MHPQAVLPTNSDTPNKQKRGKMRKIISAVPRKWKARLHRAMNPQGDVRGVIDLRAVTDDPIEAYYIAHRKSPVIEACIRTIRTFQCVGLPLDKNFHPFVATANLIKKDGHASYYGSPLHTYHNSFQPKNAFELLRINSNSNMIERGFGSPFSAVLPWWPDISGIRPEDREVSLATTAVADYRASGLSAPLDATMYEFGPFSAELGNFEYKRLQKLTEIIGEEGYKRSDTFDGDIKAVALINSQKEVRYLLNGGQHRAAVAVALGLERLPVRLFPTISSPLIRRDDVNFWPHVKSGLFSRDQALSVFDRIFEGTPLPNVQWKSESCPNI